MRRRARLEPRKPSSRDNRISPGKAANLAKKQITALDEKIKKLSGLITRIDAALVDPNAYSRDKGKATPARPSSARTSSARSKRPKTSGCPSRPPLDAAE